MMCELLPTNEVHSKFREIMMDIYVICLEYMFEYGTERKDVFDKKYELRGNFGRVEQHQYQYFPDHLHSPISFQMETTVITKICNGREKYYSKTTPNFNAPQYIDLSISNGDVHKNRGTFDMCGIVA